MTASDQQINEFNQLWEDDLLERRPCADFLTKYLTGRYKQLSKPQSHEFDSFVLNVRADWGFGKTFFLRHWCADLKLKGHPTVYFDAWENDFSNDPLVGFIAELELQLVDFKTRMPLAEQYATDALTIAKRFIKTSGITLISHWMKKATGSGIEELATAIENQDPKQIGKSLIDETARTEILEQAQKAVRDHLARKQSIQEFKKGMQALVECLQKEAGKQLQCLLILVTM